MIKYINNIDKGQKIGESKLKKVEQEILLEAAKAHTELLLNSKKININFYNLIYI